jgi:hypothetical protein
MNKINVHENLSLMFSLMTGGKYEKWLAVLLTIMVRGEQDTVFSVIRSAMNE